MKDRIKIGILFGGCSREREISFAGGRTVYDNLDKGLFEPVPIFIDSFRNFIQLDWRYLYQGSIRDFYSPSQQGSAKVQTYIESLGPFSAAACDAYMARIGKRIAVESLRDNFDFAFLALHGPYGEDGRIQGLLEWFQIPYSGSGILGAALGIDKIIQKKWMQQGGYLVAPYKVITRSDWLSANKESLFADVKAELGLPLVVKSPRQGSSIGVNIVQEDDLGLFTKAIHSSFFIEEITASQWQALSANQKEQWLIQLVDLRVGIGLPVAVQGEIIYQPEHLLAYLESYFKDQTASLLLHSLAGEEAVLVESFIRGREFSCIVLQEADAQPVALSPTEMLKGDLHLDYRAKYLPGLVQKETPMQVPLDQLEAIKAACVGLFQDLCFQTYARIDGILSPNNTIYLNDPNTTAGMQPSSFLFHQAAEIGLTPSRLLTFVVRNALAKAIHATNAPLEALTWLEQMDEYISTKVGMDYSIKETPV